MEKLTCCQVLLVLDIELKLIKRGESGLPVKKLAVRWSGGY